MKPPVLGSLFFSSSYYAVSTEQKAISVPNLSCYEYFRSLWFSWNKRKPLKFSMCIAEMNSVCFFSISTSGWPKSLSVFHKYIEKVKERLGYRKLFKETATMRKKNPGMIITQMFITRFTIYFWSQNNLRSFYDLTGYSEHLKLHSD